MNPSIAYPHAPAHVIETLSWTSTGGDRAQAVAHQMRVSEYLRGPGRRLLDRLFSRLSPPGEAWRLDTLEVDLGRLPATASFAEWSVRLEQALWLRLNDARRTAQAPAMTAAVPDLQPSSTRTLEHFLYYLQRGHLPWSVSPQAGRELAQWLERLAQRFGLGLWTRLQRLHPAGDVLFRLGRIAPHHGLQALLAVRDPELANSLQLLDAQLLAPLHARGRLSAYQLQAIQQDWRVAGLQALWGRYAGGLSADRMHRLREALAASLARHIGHDWRRVLRQRRNKVSHGRSGTALLDTLLQHLLDPGHERHRTAAMPPDAVVPWPTELRALLDVLLVRDANTPMTAELCARLATLRARHPRELQAALRPLALQRTWRRDRCGRVGLPVLWPWLAALTVPASSSHRSASTRTGAPLDPTSADAVRLPAGAAWAESLRQFALRTLADGHLGRDAPGLSALQAWLADASMIELTLGGRPPQDHAGWTRLWQRALLRWPGAPARSHATASGHPSPGPTSDPLPAGDVEWSGAAANHTRSGDDTVDRPTGDDPAAGRVDAVRIAPGVMAPKRLAPHVAPSPSPPSSRSAQVEASLTPTATVDAIHASFAPTAARTLDTPHAAVLAALACAREGAPPPDTATRLRLLDALADAATRAQWLRRSTPAQRWALLERLLPREVAPLRAASRYLQRAHAHACPAKPDALRERQHWRFLARHLLREGLPAQPALLARRYALHLAATDATLTPRPSALAHWQQRLRRALRATTPQRRTDRVSAAMQRALRTPPTGAERSELIEHAGRTHGSIPDAVRSAVPAPVPTPAQTSTPAPPPATAGITAIATTAPCPDQDIRHYLDNAGLVLLATWTPRLFARLDLLDGNRLRDPAALARAVRCLAWLVHGHDRASEPECVLPKLLCGLEITAPLVPSAPLDPDTCALLDGLLQSVIAHWSALGQTSLVGMRQTFLQREGRLAHLPESTPPHWHLAVSSGPFDMLLDHLPWSFATLKLPWMPEVLHVQWR